MPKVKSNSSQDQVGRSSEVMLREKDPITPLTRTVCFYSPPLDGSTPKYVTLDMTKDGSRNYPHHEVDIRICDIRGHESDFKLNIHGFQAVTDNTITSFNSSTITGLGPRYASDVVKLLLKYVEGSEEVIIFDTTIRRASKSEVLNRPVRKVHIDQSTRGAYLRARQSLSKDIATKIEAGELRFRIVNVWKPLDSPVGDHPLMFADSTTVEEADLVPVEQQYPHYSGETFAVKHNDTQSFWFWSNMTTSDLVMLQCFDSLETIDGHGNRKRTRCAHGSFQLSETHSETFTRSSIELRCLVLG